MGHKKKQSLKASIPSLWQILVRFGPLIRKQRRLIAGSMAAMFAEIGIRLLEPWPVALVLGGILVGEGTGIGFVDALPWQQQLAIAAGSLVVLASLRAFALYLRRVGFALAGSRILTQCRGELFAQLQRLSLSFHSKARTGDLITRVTGDIGRLKEVAITAAMPLLAHVITLMVIFAVLFFMNWRLALIAIAVMPLFLLSTVRIGGRIRKVARLQRQRKGEMGATAAEAIGSIKTVQSLAIEDVHGQAFAARNKSDMREGVKAKRLSARLIGFTDVLIAIGTAAVLWYGATLVMSDALSLAELIATVAYVKMALRPIRTLAKYTGRIAKAAASAERVLEILDLTPQVRDRPGAEPAPAPITSVRFDDVTFGYEDNVTAVSNLTFEAKRGDVVVLAGPSGAGKSTIVNLLLRLYDPREGTVMANGRDIRTYTLDSLRRSIAVVPQENVLFAVSLRDNIAYGAPGATDEDVEAAARLARAHKFIAALPDGYNTQVGERGGTLSEGQRQRIAIARAVIRQASILVLDEPTASLDNQNNRVVREALESLSHDRITFVVAHDLSTVPEDSRVLFLEDGAIVEAGIHRELLERGGRYAAMHALHGRDTSARDPGRGRTHALES